MNFAKMPRGALWLVGQLALFAGIALCPGTPLNWRSPAVALLVAGAGLALAALIGLGRSLSPFPAPLARGELITNGVFSFARHPIYTGLIGAALAFSIMSSSIPRFVLTVVLALFFDAKARAEEVLLAKAYPGYRDYARKTRKFLPWIY